MSQCVSLCCARATRIRLAGREAFAAADTRRMANLITGDLKSKIDSVWNDFWSGGISNPLEVMEQLTYLLFIKGLDEQQTLKENKANRSSPSRRARPSRPGGISGLSRQCARSYTVHLAIGCPLGRSLPSVALVIGVLLLAGCATSASDPLIGLASRCEVSAVRQLLDDGRDPNRLDATGSSALFYAATALPGADGCLETLEAMRQAGGDPTRIERGDSIFAAIAFYQEDLRIADWLLSHGADPCVPLSEERRETYGVDTIPDLARSTGNTAMGNYLEEIMARCKGG